MTKMNYDDIFNRTQLKEELGKLLRNTKMDVSQKRGIYIYGAAGIGKTTFVTSLIEENGYDVLRYDAGDMRNKAIIESITKNNIAQNNVMSMFYKKSQPIVIVMDDIDGMNSGDKGGINALIKLIRPKKTKKQQSEQSVYHPIVCIGNFVADKKIKELMKTCHCFELPTPSSTQVLEVMYKSIPGYNELMYENMVGFIQGDLNKLEYLKKLHTTNPDIFKKYVLSNAMKRKRNNIMVKEAITDLITSRKYMREHNYFMNETDRTIIGLLWHENVIDCLADVSNEVAYPLYAKILDSICFADYIDRTTFQHQIWQLNELSSLLKTFHTNSLYHEVVSASHKPPSKEIRFTKVLTKYSTEYNNKNFIFLICDKLGLDKKDVVSFVLKHGAMYKMYEPHEISKLETDRLVRYVEAFHSLAKNSI